MLGGYPGEDDRSFLWLVSMDLDIASFVSIKRLLGGHKA